MTDKKPSAAAMISLGALTMTGMIVLWIVWLIAMLILDGYLFSNIWKWWVSPTLGVREITMVEAMGISLVVAYYRNSTPGQKSKNVGVKELLGNYASNLVKDFIVYGLAYGLLFFK